MGNTLKDIFSVDDPKFEVNLKFKSKESFESFQEALKRVYDEGESVCFDGVSSVTFVAASKTGKYPINEDNDITNLFISPYLEPVPFTINTDYGEYTFGFTRKKNNKEIIISNSITDIVHLTIRYKLSENIANLSYKTNPQIADNVETIIKSYNATWHLFTKLFIEKTHSKVTNIINSFRLMESYWKRVREIERDLNISFCPKNIKGELNDRQCIEELYILLIRKMPLRENLKDITITSNHLPDEVKKGGNYVITNITDHEYNVYGCTIPVYTVDCIFNSIVEDIKQSEDKTEYIVKCTGTDTEPIYKSSLGFKTKEEAELVLQDISKNFETLSAAKTINEIIKEMIKF